MEIILKEFTLLCEVTEENIDEIIKDCYETYWHCDDESARAGMWKDIIILETLQKGMKIK